MNISNETLMAYLDGELDPETRLRVKAAVAADPALAARVAQQQALIGQLRSAFDDTLHEPVPPRLLAAARAETDSVAAPPARKRRAAALASAWAQSWLPPRRGAFGGALAASLIAGVLLGHALTRPPPGALPFVDGSLVARGALAKTLSVQLASNPDPAAPVHVGLSFRAKSGDYCRTFAVSHEDQRPPYAGLACKEAPGWRIHTLTETDRSGTPDYRMAASNLPAAVLAAVDRLIDGDPLDAGAERAARDGGWTP